MNDLNLKSLLEYIQDLEDNYNSLFSIYEEGVNKTGKTKEQLLYRAPDYAGFKKMYRLNENPNLESRIFRLKNNFNKLLDNQVALKSIASIIFVNIYNVNNYGVSEIQSHLYEQIKKIEFILETDLSKTYIEIIQHNNGKKIQLNDKFFKELSELEFDGEEIFADEVEDMVNFKKKFELLMTKKFSQISSPLNFQVPNKKKYVAHYIITELMRLVGLENDFSPLEKVILINCHPFDSTSRNNSWSKNIQPRVNGYKTDVIFDDLVHQLSRVISTLN